jgi:uncharacterized protein involved in exopolysaccharide biosynthesis
VALVKSPGTEKAVLDALDADGRLKEGAALPAVLRRDLEVVVKGDVLEISFWAHDAATAATVANAWAKEYENLANEAYSEAATQAGPLHAARAEFTEAQSRYEAAEAELSRFAATNQLAAAERSLEEKNRNLSLLHQTKLDALSDFYAERRRARRLLDAALALKEQIEAESKGSPGSAFALLLLKQDVYVVGQGNESWQLDFSTLPVASQEDLEKEIAATVEGLKKRLAQLGEGTAADAGAPGQSAVDTWVKRALGGAEQNDIEAVITRLEADVRQLQGRMAAEQAQKKQLTQLRDQAWQTYQTVSSKVEELQLGSRIPAVEVKVVSPAPAPTARSRSALKIGVFWGGVAFAAACLLALFLEYAAMDSEQKA